MDRDGKIVMAPWWAAGVLYQIYPRSFQDSNGDGIGDLPGIISRLPYLRGLGVDAIWLSPIFPSPMADFGYDISDYVGVDPLFGTMADFGYDISDYTGVDPIFGTLDDFDRLVRSAHASNIKVLLDLVPNHTSDQHPWFIESRSSRENPKRDWYLWREPRADGSAPNNWMSEFGGGAWKYDSHTEQYYYHAFLAEQPDLNWRNPAVRQAIYDVMRFWLRRGVDGFRVDVIWHLIKDAQLRDNPSNPNFHPGRPPHQALLPLYSTDRPEVLDVIAEMRRVVDEFDHRVLIGEIYLPIERLVAYYGKDLAGAHLPFNFTLLSAPWHARDLATLIDSYERALPAGAWPNWVLGNHDRPRIASRIGRAQARVAAMLLLTLRGTPTMYYGDEIGMQQVAIAPDQVRDPFEKNVPGIGVGRDGCRTPMQWDATAHAGFTNGTPWLPAAENYLHENAANLAADAHSILNLYRALVDMRKHAPELVFGDYVAVAATGDLLIYKRTYAANALLVILNLGSDPCSIEPTATGYNGEILLSTNLDRAGEVLSNRLDLRSDEGLIIRLA